MSRIYIRLNTLAGPDAARAPLLERLLARAERIDAGTDWRQRAFQGVAGETVMPGIGAAALCGELGRIEGGAVFIASPVHCEAGMVSVRMSANGLIRLDGAEASQLAHAFNQDFADGAQRLIAAPSGRLFCVLASATAAATRDPLDVCGRDIGPLLPEGPDAPRLRRLISETEMWLFEHPFNRARIARGAVPLTGLWLWGGGAPLAALPPLAGWTAGSDALFGAWPAQPVFPREAGPGVIALDVEPGSEAWQRTQGAWVAPALAALRSGRIRQLEVSIGAHEFSLRASGSLRFWRRTRPWWEYLQ